MQQKNNSEEMFDLFARKEMFLNIDKYNSDITTELYPNDGNLVISFRV